MTRFLALALTLAACSGDDTPADVDDTDSVDTDEPGPTTGDTGTTATDGPTWNADVSSIVVAHCVACHQSGGIGPFSLETYEDSRTWGYAMRDAVVDRRMPPWLVTDDGTCGDWRDSRWLDDADIQTLDAWVEADMPEGDPADAPTGEPPAPLALDRVDHVVATPAFVPEIQGGATAEFDEYRCFAIDNPTGEDLFITGYDIDPGNDAIVHHVLGMPVNPMAMGWDGQPNGLHIGQMDGRDGREGWECFGTAGGDIREDGVPIVWAPGMGAVQYPEDVGVRLGADEVLVVQVHYNLVDPTTHGQSDSTSIQLRTESEVAREAYFALPDAFLESIFYGNPDEIPPGESSYEYSFSIGALSTLLYAQAPLSGGFDLLGVMPHMHALGSKQRLTLHRAATATDECLADVQQWDFNWQLFYMYDEPVPVVLGDELEVTCTWDTSAVTGPTLPGWGTYNEMCLMVMMIVPN